MVQPDGFISRKAPDISIVEVDSGRSRGEKAIKKEYEGHVARSIVDIDLGFSEKPFSRCWAGGNARPIRLTLRHHGHKAIAVAGGFADGKTAGLLYRGVSSNWAEGASFYQRILTEKISARTYNLRPGDMIFVPEKADANFKKNYVLKELDVRPHTRASY